MRQEQDAKDREAGGGAVAPLAPATACDPPVMPEDPTSPDSASQKKENAGAGLSAADAQNSISKGGSLRERMAALKGAGAFGTPPEKPQAPAPSGKTWKRPPAPEPEPAEEGEETADGAESVMKAKTLALEEGDTLAAAGGEMEGEEEAEEEKEKAKRAAIAARMAKLGGRDPMGMAIPPKPTRKPTRDVTQSPSEE